jgi:uncharacterized membrane protein YGL010W
MQIAMLYLQNNSILLLVVVLVIFLSKNTISLTEMKITIPPAEILEFKEALIFYLRVLKLRQEINVLAV